MAACWACKLPWPTKVDRDKSVTLKDRRLVLNMERSVSFAKKENPQHVALERSLERALQRSIAICLRGELHIRSTTPIPKSSKPHLSVLATIEDSLSLEYPSACDWEFNTEHCS